MVGGPDVEGLQAGSELSDPHSNREQHLFLGRGVDDDGSSRTARLLVCVGQPRAGPAGASGWAPRGGTTPPGGAPRPAESAAKPRSKGEASQKRKRISSRPTRRDSPAAATTAPNFISSWGRRESGGLPKASDA